MPQILPIPAKLRKRPRPDLWSDEQLDKVLRKYPGVATDNLVREIRRLNAMLAAASGLVHTLSQDIDDLQREQLEVLDAVVDVLYKPREP
jgi:hypothetical protein